eukprot:UN26204
MAIALSNSEIAFSMSPKNLSQSIPTLTTSFSRDSCLLKYSSKNFSAHSFCNEPPHIHVGAFSSSEGGPDFPHFASRLSSCDELP